MTPPPEAAAPRSSAARMAPPAVAPVPVAPTPVAPAPVAPAPVPAPVAPAPAPPPANQFDPDLGPEPTQIGAMPLISFGDVPLVALIGENAQRTPAPVAAPPGATFLPDAGGTERSRTKLLVIVAAVVVVVAAVVVVLVLR